MIQGLNRIKVRVRENSLSFKYSLRIQHHWENELNELNITIHNGKVYLKLLVDYCISEAISGAALKPGSPVAFE